MTKLFYSPGSCALGIHVLLEEIGAPFELAKVNLAAREQFSPDYVKINPKSKVPALMRDDGSVLTEWPAIATWLALNHPDKGLLSLEKEQLARTLEAVDYVCASLHMQGFTRVWKPEAFSPNADDHGAVKARGQEIVDKGLAWFDGELASKAYLGGAQMSIADAALFFLEFWVAERLKQPLPAHVGAHYARMRARPAVAKALAHEGLA
jgi:glutathione S-transferase